MLYEQIAKQLKDFDISSMINLQNYYDSKPAIIDRTFTDTSKPNNKLVNNYAAYIVDIIQGYFIGKPISYTCEDEQYLEDLQKVFDDNDERVENTMLANQLGIKGKVYEIVYVNEESKICFAKVNAENMIPIYSNAIKPELIGVIRTWVDGEINYWEYYDKYVIKTGTYKREGDKDNIEIIAEQTHFFDEIPVIEYINNEGQFGDFERVISLIDAYDKSRSDTANDFEYFTDAYLKLTGAELDVEADADDIKRMRNNRLLMLPEGATAEFLIKSINDTALENHNNRLRGDIHKFSFTPDLTDAAFGGSISGIALQFKLFGLEQIAQTKENFFRLGLKKRIRLITKILNLKGANYDANDVQMTFTRNMPINLQELVNTLISLKGTISNRTILANLPIIDDVEKELELLEKENEGLMSIDDAEKTPTVEGGDLEDDTEDYIEQESDRGTEQDREEERETIS